MAEQERVILVPEDPVHWFQSECKSRPLTGLVFERGDWCPYCRHDVNEWREQLPRIEALGGTFFIVTAQDEEILRRSASNWGLENIPIVSDPDNLLARHLNFVVSEVPIRESVQCHFDAYKNGVCQPGYVLVNQDGAEIAGWRQTPTEHNIGGAVDRPIPARVLDYVEVKTHKGSEADIRGPNEDLEAFDSLIEELFDELPEDIQQLLRQERGAGSIESKRFVVPSVCGDCPSKVCETCG